VPDENIMNDLGGLCIRRSNLNFLGSEIVDANLKKSAIQIFRSNSHCSPTDMICSLRNMKLDRWSKHKILASDRYFI